MGKTGEGITSGFTAVFPRARGAELGGGFEDGSFDGEDTWVGAAARPSTAFLVSQEGLKLGREAPGGS